MVEIMLHDGKTEVMLKFDKGNFSLFYPEMVKDKETGELKPGYAPRKHFASIPAALDALLKLKVGHSDARSLGELREAIVVARRELLAAYDTQLKKVGSRAC